jgi:CYTH domain-containing protein
VALSACGNNNDTISDSEAATENDYLTEETEAAQEITKVDIGQSIESDNFKMVIESMKILDKYSYSTNDASSFYLNREGYKLLMVQGSMENTGNAAINVSSFYTTAVVNGNNEFDNDDVQMCFERDNSSEIDPYTEQTFDIYINIPKKLADQFETATFTLGFNGDMSPLTVTTSSDGQKTVDADNWFSITQTQADNLVDTFGISISLPENPNWIKNTEYNLIDKNNLKITYYDAIAEADCTVFVANNESLTLPEIEYDESLNESWEGETTDNQNILVTVKHGKDASTVLATWEYNTYKFAIIGEDEDSSESIPKVALNIIYNLE